jgi:hypothetical protein
MLRSLDSLTVAGRRYTMGKVLDCLERAFASTLEPSEHNRKVLKELLARVAGAANAAAPNACEFARAAESFLLLLDSNSNSDSDSDSTLRSSRAETFTRPTVSVEHAVRGGPEEPACPRPGRPSARSA